MAGWPAHIEQQVLKRAAAADMRLAAAYRALTLLARYPDISGAEADEILSYVKRASATDIRLIADDEPMRRQFERFVGSHSRQLRYSAVEVVTGIGVVVAFFAICWLLWQSIGGS